MSFIQRYFLRHPIRTRRALEILPGSVSWFLILFPLWGSLLIPEVVAVYIIAFTVYWLYKSLSVAIFSLVGHFRLEATLEALSAQTYPLKKIHIILSFEEREGEVGRQKAKNLIHEFGKKFGSIHTTFHPDVQGEVKGKSSNSAWAAKSIVEPELIKKEIVDVRFTTITSHDADARLHQNYFAALTYSFLDNPRHYQRFWQPAVMFYNNIWRVPAPIRALATIWSVVHLYVLCRRDRLVNFSTYSTSLKLLKSVGYWDTDVIPEDYRIFFKTYFATKGKVSVDPIFLPALMDAAQSSTFWKTMINQYEQVKRWAWGVADDQFVIRQAVLVEGIPLKDNILRILRLMEDHFLWPVNWFALTLGALLPPLLNPTFSRTVIGKTLPQVSSGILTISLVAILIVLFVDAKRRPKSPKKISLIGKIIQPLELLLLPVVGFFFNALPGLDAHTRLMLGRYLEYRVTEKVE